MKLSEIKSFLKTVHDVTFRLPDGTRVPEHFHVTEIGEITKNFIDCGGTVRNEKVVNFQLWTATDYDHRLKPEKLLKIIELSEKVLGIKEGEVEVEYQGETIGKFGLEIQGEDLLLTAMKTDCLAKDNCGVPQEKPRLKLQELGSSDGSCCTPGGTCC
jgi:hypothetical protein